MHSHSHPEIDERETSDTLAALATAKASAGSSNSHNRIFPCNAVLRDRLRAMRDEPGSGFSNQKIANRLGCSVTVVSLYLNKDGCKYNGDRANLERNIDDFLRNQERRRASGIETTGCHGAEQMLAAFNYIRKTNDVGAVVAEPGEGKSRGIEIIREANPLAILFTVRAWSCDKGSLQSALWDCIPHIGYDAQTKRASFIVASLRGSDRPLIVDDAHKLTRPALHLLFDLWDETSIPICLIGTDELLRKLEDDSQRFSRVGIHWTIKSNTVKGRKLIEHMVKTLAPGANGEFEELCDLCEQVSSQHGHFRSVHKQLKLAAELRSAKKDKPWCQCFRDAHEMLLRQYKLA